MKLYVGYNVRFMGPFDDDDDEDSSCCGREGD